MDSREKRAKEIYFQYAGNKFQMMRDGINEEYSQYHITVEQEKEWLIELIIKNINQLDINNKNSLFPLWYVIIDNCEISYIGDVIDFISANKNKAVNSESFLSFTAKVEDVIERAENTCKTASELLNSYKRRIKLLKKNG